MKPASGETVAVEALARGVGALVRAGRTGQGLTRRALAEQTSISERYLAQLEGGAANVSLNLLARIGATLGVSIHALIPTDAPAGSGRKKGFALIGLRGAGKTTLGERLSQMTGLAFERLTQTIVERAGMETGELMELAGSEAFRRMEVEALQDLIAQPGQIVLETSGGIVADGEAYDLVRKHFHTVWVKAAPEDHMARVVAQNDLRPMAGREAAMDDLRRLLAERQLAYAQAEFVLDTHGLTADAAATRLHQLLEPLLG